jgi:hypothetical protein
MQCLIMLIEELSLTEWKNVALCLLTTTYPYNFIWLLIITISISLDTNIVYIYLTGLSVTLTMQLQRIGWQWIMILKGCERKRSSHISGHFSGIYTEKQSNIMRDLGRDSQCPGRDSNHVPLKHTSETSPLEQTAFCACEQSLCCKMV